MNITYTWRNTDKADAIEDLVTKKLEKITKHFDKINQIQITFETVKQNHTAKAALHLPGEEINAHATHDDMYKAIDDMMHKLMRQVDTYKEKLKSHRDKAHKENENNDGHEE